MIADFIRRPDRPDRIVMVTVFACSIAAGWAMLPGENERVAMLERDGHSREALTILEQQVTGGDKRYRTLHQLLALYENEGNISKARSVIEQMSTERPSDPILKRRLAKFYKNNNVDAEYVKAMQDLIDIRYSEPMCRELIGWLRFKGDSAAEQATLQRCRQKGYRRADDLSRLAEFVAADGDAAQAAGLLRSIDDLKRLKELRERFQLLSLLAELDQPKEAERRALRWIRANRDNDAMAVNLIDHLARSKHPESAYEVAKDGGIPGDGISLTVAERLVEKSQNGAALLYLRGWLDRAKTVDADTAIRFVDASLGVGDPRLALQAARQFGYVLLPQRSLEKIGEALDRAQATAEAAEVRTVIAGVAPPLPTTVSAVQPQDGNGQTAAVENALVSGSDTTSRVRSILLVDPLEGWRRSLYLTMTNDAQRRAGALFVGPKAPPLHAGRHFAHAHSRGEHQSLNAKVFKKTSRVLQRTKKFTALKAKRYRANTTTENLPFSDSQDNSPTVGKTKVTGKPKP
jgi:hypothetical protein